jgi:hypothetical protein
MDVPFTDRRMDSIANPHLNDDPGAIITFPGETFGLVGRAVNSVTLSRITGAIGKACERRTSRCWFIRMDNVIEV